MPRYADLRDDLKTGDILLFAGEDKFSQGIRLVTGGIWSHVAMVVVLELPGEQTMVAAWESTTLSPVKDLWSGKEHKGVSLVSLSDRVAKQVGRIAVRPLSDPIDEPMEAALWEARKLMARRPYERDFIELAKSAYDGPFGTNREDLSSVFCSELVAEAYQGMALLPDVEDGGPPSNEYTPRDFSTSALNPLELMNGYELLDEVEIDTGPASVQ
ncbi:MAG: hypothetical protein AAFY08_13740 [Planctomycetota bacterium]